MEASHQNTQFMKGKTECTISKVTHEQRSASNVDKPDFCKKRKCYRCGKQGHAGTDCPFKDSKCHKCGRQGHLAKVCRTKGINLTERIETHLPPSAHMDNVIFRVGNRESQPYQVVLKVNNQVVIMEVDTGAAVTIMSSKSFNSLFPRATSQETTFRLCTYMAKEIPILGQKSVNVQYGDYSGSHTVCSKGRWTMSLGERLAAAHTIRLGQYKSCVCDKEFQG